MRCDDIVSGRNNVGMNKYAINLTFYGFVFVKRMQIFSITLVILEKGALRERKFLLVYQSRCQNREIRELNCEFDHYIFVVTNNQTDFDILLITISNI